MDIAKSMDIGFSRIVNIGNKAHLSELDIIKAFVFIIIGTYMYSWFLSGIWLKPLSKKFKQ